MTNFFNNQNLVEIIWKWRMHFIIVGILAIVVSAIFSSSIFIKPKFKSTALIYPSNNIYVFSDESQSEQLLEITSSLDIKLRTIDAFNLDEAYKISKEETQYLTHMLAEFNDNVKFKKTQYETVEISVLDTDPQRACNMCDSIIHFVDEKIGFMHKIKHDEVAAIAKKDYAFISHKVDSLEEKLNFFRTEYQILDYRTQAEEITKGMVKVLASQQKNSAGGKELSKWLKNLSEKGGEYEILDKQQKKMISQKDSIMKVYDQSVSSANKKIIYGHRVQNPIPADRKSYPVRSIILLISTFAALFVALLVVLLIENKKTT
jgi:capsule polysaccharide export protein KpsE/RkpR